MRRTSENLLIENACRVGDTIISVSAGWLSTRTESVEEALAAADELMYKQKSQKKAGNAKIDARKK